MEPIFGTMEKRSRVANSRWSLSSMPCFAENQSQAFPTFWPFGRSLGRFVMGHQFSVGMRTSRSLNPRTNGDVSGVCEVRKQRPDVGGPVSCDLGVVAGTSKRVAAIV
jgi:hypothetical protein